MIATTSHNRIRPVVQSLARVDHAFGARIAGKYGFEREDYLGFLGLVFREPEQGRVEESGDAYYQMLVNLRTQVQNLQKQGPLLLNNRVTLQQLGRVVTRHLTTVQGASRVVVREEGGRLLSKEMVVQRLGQGMSTGLGGSVERLFRENRLVRQAERDVLRVQSSVRRELGALFWRLVVREGLSGRHGSYVRELLASLSYGEGERTGSAPVMVGAAMQEVVQESVVRFMRVLGAAAIGGRPGDVLSRVDEALRTLDGGRGVGGWKLERESWVDREIERSLRELRMGARRRALDVTRVLQRLAGAMPESGAAGMAGRSAEWLAWSGVLGGRPGGMGAGTRNGVAVGVPGGVLMEWPGRVLERWVRWAAVMGSSVGVGASGLEEGLGRVEDKGLPGVAAGVPIGRLMGKTGWANLGQYGRVPDRGALGGFLRLWHREVMAAGGRGMDAFLPGEQWLEQIQRFGGGGERLLSVEAVSKVLNLMNASRLLSVYTNSNTQIYRNTEVHGGTRRNFWNNSILRNNRNLGSSPSLRNILNLWSGSDLRGNAILESAPSIWNVSNHWSSNSLTRSNVNSPSLWSISNLWNNSILRSNAGLGSSPSYWSISNLLSNPDLRGNVNLGSSPSHWNSNNLLSNPDLRGNVNLGSNSSLWNISNLWSNLVLRSNAGLGSSPSYWSISNLMSNLDLRGNVSLGSNPSFWNISNLWSNLVLRSNTNLGSNPSHWSIVNLLSNPTLRGNVNLGGNPSFWNVSNLWNNSILRSNANLGGNLSHWSITNLLSTPDLRGAVNLGSNPSLWNISNLWGDLVLRSIVNQGGSSSVWNLSNLLSNSVLRGNVNLGGSSSVWNLFNLLSSPVYRGNASLGSRSSHGNISNLWNMSNLTNVPRNGNVSQIGNVSIRTDFSSLSKILSLPSFSKADHSTLQQLTPRTSSAELPGEGGTRSSTSLRKLGTTKGDGPYGEWSSALEHVRKEKPERKEEAESKPEPVVVQAVPAQQAFTAPGNTGSTPMPDFNLNEFVERVYEELEKKIRFEQERMGL